MSKYVSHIRVYVRGAADSDEAEVILEIFYDGEGRETFSSSSNGERCRYYYDAEGRKARMVSDDPEGLRTVWTYAYDPDGGLVHVCSERFLEAYERDLYGQEWWEWVPTGYRSDEWYGWEDEGRTCRRHLTIREEDGTVEEVIHMEKYDGRGRLLEIRTSYGDAFTKTSLFDERGREVGRLVNGEWTDRLEYVDDAEGNWIESRWMRPDGSLSLLVVREIEYGPDTDA